VEVRTSREVFDGADAVTVTVADDGEGIPPDRLGRIFEPFFTTKSRGTGLGLAIARKVVEGHGGRVFLTSEAGAGTTVTLTVPETATEIAA
jgi:signal transduction histidine kinase